MLLLLFGSFLVSTDAAAATAATTTAYCSATNHFIHKDGAMTTTETERGTIPAENNKCGAVTAVGVFAAAAAAEGLVRNRSVIWAHDSHT